MERLTIRNSDGSVSQPMDLRWGDALNRLAAYEDTGLEPEQCAEYAQAEKEGRYIVLKEPRSAGVHKLEEIARADIDGRLVVLPCKVGEPCFRIYSCHCGCRERCKKKKEAKLIDVVHYRYANAYTYYCKRIAESKFTLKDIANFGKTVFRTREEAEAVLKARRQTEDSDD